VTRARGLLREHWLFCVVFLAAVLLRAAMQRAFGPALFYLGDSFDYLDSAYKLHWDEAHPNGYPLILALLALPGYSLTVISVTQHLAGLAVGVLCYALLLQLRVHRYLAAAAAALVLLNSWQIVLEQHVMAEAFFTLALVASVYLVVTRGGPRATAASGILMGAGALIRGAGLFAAPVWLAYAVWKRRAWRAAAVAAVAVVLPIVGYCTLHAADGRGFALTQWDGWLLYGRVAQLADCRVVDVSKDLRPLCESPAQFERRRARGWTPSEYVFNPYSPPHRLYGPYVTVGPNATLRRFAAEVIRERPLRYVRMVAADTTYFFRPAGWRIGFDPGIVLHEQREFPWKNTPNPVVRRYFPGTQIAKAWPMDAVVDYSRYTRPPRPLLAALVLAALVSLVLALAGRGRLQLPHQPESTFLAGLALAMLVGSTATVELNLRFLVPALPLIACAGALALTDLGALALGAVRTRRGGVAGASQYDPSP
jgi:hypothetical protein